MTGLVLAAGAGRRLGRPKAEIELGGRRLVDHAVAALNAGGCDPVLVVTRDPDLVVAGARAVLNPAPEDGMGGSLRVGLSSVDTEACVIALVDQPDLDASDVAAVIAAFVGGARLVAARRSGRRSHPVLLAREDFAECARSATGDRGARTFLDDNAGRIRYVDLSGPLVDIDTPAELERARRRFSG